MRRAAILAALLLTGCATVPPAPVSAFERCMATVASDKYSNEKMRAADWCRANDNGGIR